MLIKKSKIQIWEKMFPALGFSPTSLPGIVTIQSPFLICYCPEQVT